MENLLPIGAVVLGLIAAYALHRLGSLGRGMKAYSEAQRLASKDNLTPSESQRLTSLRQRAVQAWGASMDPGLPVTERLKLLKLRDQWILQKIDGSERRDHLELFAEAVLWFLQKYERGYSSRQFDDEVALRFARAVAGPEYRRLVAAGMDESTAATRARAEAALVTKHFFGAGENPDGTWRVIRPEVDTATSVSSGGLG